MSNNTKKIIDFMKRYRTERGYKTNNRNPKCWLFGEWYGDRCNDNSCFLANAVTVLFPEIEAFWVARKNSDVSKLNKSIKVLLYDSEENRDIFMKVGVVIMNQGFIDFSSSGYNYFRGAITVNLWHGIAWKRIGHDMIKKSGIVHKLGMIVYDYFERADKYLSLSNEYSKILYSAFHVKNKDIIKSGYPRNSLFYSTDWLDRNKNNIISSLRYKRNNNISSTTRFIVYMPTFRDATNEVMTLELLDTDSDFMQFLDDEDLVILQKGHYVSQKRDESVGRKHNNRILSLENMAAYELLGVADILITDYSSCFFDFLLLNRPIIHFLYDLNEYKNIDRGLYYDLEDVICGKVAVNFEELKQTIKEYVNSPNADSSLRSLRKQHYMEYETPRSCEEIANEIKKIAERKLS